MIKQIIFTDPRRCSVGSVFILSVILHLIFFSLPLSAQVADLPIRRDDFNQVHDWWAYHRDGSAQQDDQAIINGRGYLLLQLKNPLSSHECNVAISDLQNIYGKRFPYLRIEIRARVLDAMLPGSRGWGLWKSSKNASFHTLAWFMEQFTPQSKTWSWRLVGAARYERRKVVPWVKGALNWHVYAIERDLPGKTIRFWIDDSLVLWTHNWKFKDRLAFHAWIDNQIYTKSSGVLREGWRGKSRLALDYVEIRTQKRVPALPTPGSSAIVFYKKWDQILTKKIYRNSFAFAGGKLFLLATARAEAYDSLDQPDRLQIEINGKPALTFDGQQLKGATATLFKELELPPGEHALTLNVLTTPLLYDVLLLDAKKIEQMVRIKNLLELPEASKQLAGEGKILLYAAATLREAPQAFFKKESDDDDRLKISLLNGKSVISWRGNRQFGNPNSALIELLSSEQNLEVNIQGQPEVHGLFLFKTK